MKPRRNENAKVRKKWELREEKNVLERRRERDSRMTREGE